MWAGQLANEAFNWVLKEIVRENRPGTSHGDGYGFPSSHSQYHLTYHTPPQIIWGAVIGVCTGTLHYGVTELWPALRPDSSMAQLRSAILDSPIARWARIRDGWTIWPDGGKEDEYELWRKAWATTKDTNTRKIKKEE
ncbi:hypothetical protein FRC07_009973 [Ceratobasidium sp. 392]|nr:hypothetical protein FRC07_009973 [Ceratobasidium sp. 392]